MRDRLRTHSVTAVFGKLERSNQRYELSILPTTLPDRTRARTALKRALRLSTSDALLSGALVAWIVVFGTGVTSLPYLGDLGSWAKAALAGALSVVLMFGALYLTWFLVLRHLKQPTVRVVATLIVYLCAGAHRGLILSWLLALLMGAHFLPDETLYRMSANATRMSMFLLLGVYVVAVTRSQRARLAEVITKRNQAEAILDSTRNDDLNHQAATLKEVHDRLDQEITSRKKNSNGSSHALESLASEVIGPVSRELARRTPKYDVP